MKKNGIVEQETSVNTETNSVVTNRQVRSETGKKMMKALGLKPGISFKVKDEHDAFEQILRRFTEDGLCEYSNDNGETWELLSDIDESYKPNYEEQDSWQSYRNRARRYWANKDDEEVVGSLPTLSFCVGRLVNYGNGELAIDNFDERTEIVVNGIEEAQAMLDDIIKLREKWSRKKTK